MPTALQETNCGLKGYLCSCSWFVLVLATLPTERDTSILIFQVFSPGMFAPSEFLMRKYLLYVIVNKVQNSNA
jgi:hypothetical protein